MTITVIRHQPLEDGFAQVITEQNSKGVTATFQVYEYFQDNTTLLMSSKRFRTEAHAVDCFEYFLENAEKELENIDRENGLIK